LVGVVPFTLLSDFVSANFPDHINIVIGLAFLGIVYLLPDGVTGALEKLMQRRGGATPTGDVR